MATLTILLHDRENVLIEGEVRCASDRRDIDRRDKAEDSADREKALRHRVNGIKQLKAQR
jgi:hypothetical protein